MEDLSRLISTSLDESVRRREKDNFLKYYHERLSEKMGRETPLSLETVHKAYDDIQLFTTMGTLFAMPLWSKMKAVVGEEGEKGRENKVDRLLSRARAVLEDWIELHKTQEKIPSVI